MAPGCPVEPLQEKPELIEQLEGTALFVFLNNDHFIFGSSLRGAKASRIAELTSFANGISRDYAAVYAAFSRPESNGVTEGHVNRLKFLKRQMFGRASLDLLRIKVLHAV